MPMTPGYYMPNFYYNPTNPMTAPVPAQMQQSYAPASSQQQGIIWVDGEVGAKAFQMPSGWPVGTPIPLWDSNDTVIYLKSINQMGMPNPLQKLHYTMEEQKNLPSGQISGSQMPEGSNFATKDDLEQTKTELKEWIQQTMAQTNQNGSQNRGGNR